MGTPLLFLAGMSACGNDYELTPRDIPVEIEADGSAGWAFVYADGEFRTFGVHEATTSDPGGWDCLYEWSFSGYQSDDWCDGCLVTFLVEADSATTHGDSDDECADIEAVWQFPFYMSIVVVGADVDRESNEPCDAANQEGVEVVQSSEYSDDLPYAMIGRDPESDECFCMGPADLTYYASGELSVPFQWEYENSHYDYVNLSGMLHAYLDQISPGG